MPAEDWAFVIPAVVYLFLGHLHFVRLQGESGGLYDPRDWALMVFLWPLLWATVVLFWLTAREDS